MFRTPLFLALCAAAVCHTGVARAQDTPNKLLKAEQQATMAGSRSISDPRIGGGVGTVKHPRSGPANPIFDNPVSPARHTKEFFNQRRQYYPPDVIVLYPMEPR